VASGDDAVSRKIVLGDGVDELPPQDECLVSFAQSLTARPWTVGPDDVRRLSAAGLSRPSIVLAIGLVALFNYLTRVADGTGVEADYVSDLPRFVYRGVTESVPRPGPEAWPPVDHSIEPLDVLTGVHPTWCRWRDYLMDGAAPLPPETRRRLRWIAARSACDAAVAPPGDADAGPAAFKETGSGEALSRFADKLSRTPWLMAAADVDTLRSAGMDDLSILHVIAVVAYQSAESRLRIGLSALARSGV
jgi:uncharacterized protein YciW